MLYAGFDRRSGQWWRLAPCLRQLVEEVDMLSPHRSRASDGSIGDAAHAARQSDHNVKNGWVLAVDLTQDPPHFDAHQTGDGLAVRAVAGLEWRESYWVSRDPGARDDKIFTRRTLRWEHQDDDSHVTHLHTSCEDDPRARDDRSPWLVAGPAPQPSRRGERTMVPYTLDPTRGDSHHRPVAFLDPKGDTIWLYNGASLQHDQPVPHKDGDPRTFVGRVRVRKVAGGALSIAPTESEKGLLVLYPSGDTVPLAWS